MKESIFLLVLILLVTIETVGSQIVLKREEKWRDRCHRMQETRLCAGSARSLWHYDIRALECRISNETECGSTGNRFRSKEDCEQICVDRCHRMQETRLCAGAARSLWHYDIRISECRTSNEAECGGVGNRFLSEKDCEKMCNGNLNISARHSHDPPPDDCTGPKPCCGCSKSCCHDPKPPCHCSKSCCHDPKPSCCHDPKPPCCHDPKPPCHCSKSCCHDPKPPCHCSKSCCQQHDCNQPKPCCHSSSGLMSYFKSSFCGGCGTGPPCSSHHCGHCCQNKTDHNCETTTAATTTVTTTLGVPPPQIVICPIEDPHKSCYGMYCEHGFKKTTAGCPYCECKENPVAPQFRSLNRGDQPREIGRYCNNIRATCRLHCPHGYAKDRHGCDMCQCIHLGQKPSADCSLKPSCTMFCEHGFQKGPDGCDICLCNHSSTD